MESFISLAELGALGQVIMIDLVLAGDNAVAVGMAAAGLPAAQRGRVILIGIIAATVLRIIFSAATSQLLQVVGLMLAGGILLLWVSWKLWRELRESSRRAEDEGAELVAEATDDAPEHPHPQTQNKTFGQAVTQIVAADVSMSLDNVLAVAGAAMEHTWVLVTGLVLSVAMMGAAAAVIARLLQKHRWIAFVGLFLILYVAIMMIVEGGNQVYEHAVITGMI